MFRIDWTLSADDNRARQTDDNNNNVLENLSLS